MTEILDGYSRGFRGQLKPAICLLRMKKADDDLWWYYRAALLGLKERETPFTNESAMRDSMYLIRLDQTMARESW